MLATRFGNSQKSGQFETETGGHFQPKRVATLKKIGWPVSSEILNDQAVV